MRSIPCQKTALFNATPCSISNLSLHYRLFNTLLIYSTVQSPSSEANRFTASQEIPRILWNPNVHYRTHNSPAKCPCPELARFGPYTPTFHFPKLHLVLCVLLFSCVYCCSYVYLLYYVCIAAFTLDAGLLARSQY